MPLILTVPRPQAPALPAQGCWAVADWAFLAHATWLERDQAEHDETHLQLIPYLVLHDAAGHLWCYQRKGGDTRLQGRCSCGVGGHVDAEDHTNDHAGGADEAEIAQTPVDTDPAAAATDGTHAQERKPAATHPSSYADDSCQRSMDKLYSPISYQNVLTTLQRALLRELAEELRPAAADLADLQLHGLIYEGHSPVGRVHLGLLYSARWLPTAEPQSPVGEALRALGFRPPTAVATDPAFELWSRLAAQQLAAH